MARQFWTDFISDLVKGGKVDYKLHCRLRYMEYQRVQPTLITTNNPQIVALNITQVLKLKKFDLQGRKSISLGTWGPEA